MNEWFKLAHVVLSLDPGGMERFVCNLVSNSAGAEAPAVVICLDQRGALADTVERAGGTVLLLKRGPGFDAGLVLRLARVLRDLRVTTVHTHSLDAMLYGGLAAALARVPNRIHTQHNTQLRTYSLEDRMKFRLAARLFSTIVAVSAETAREVAAYGAAAPKVVLIPNGIDASRYARGEDAHGGLRIAAASAASGISRTRLCADGTGLARTPSASAAGPRLLHLVRQNTPAPDSTAVPAPGRPDETEPLAGAAPRRKTPGFRVGCVARLAPEKGIDRLLEAFALVLRRFPEASLTIAGDGPSRALLEGRARELNLGDAVEFLGYRENVPAILRGLDLFVLPSLTEGIPLALLEAMAAGLPVIATAVGGVPEVIEEGRSGLLVRPDDVTAIEWTIRELLAAPERRAELGAQARRRIEREFSLDSMAARYHALYVREHPPAWKRAARRILALLPSRWILWRGQAASNHIALSFDDGPDPFATPRILDLLKLYGARATFFLVGQNAAAERSLVRRILAEGHEIANHSFSHPDFGSLSCREAMREIERTEAVLARVAGRRTRLFRPPKGKLTLRALAAAWRKRMTVVMWSADLKDFRASNSSEITEALRVQPLRPGDIVLYHGTNPASLQALPAVLEHALEANRKAVTVSEAGGF